MSLYTTCARRLGSQYSQQQHIGQHTGHAHLPVRYAGHSSTYLVLRFLGVPKADVTAWLSRLTWLGLGLWSEYGLRVKGLGLGLGARG